MDKVVGGLFSYYEGPSWPCISYLPPGFYGNGHKWLECPQRKSQSLMPILFFCCWNCVKSRGKASLWSFAKWALDKYLNTGKQFSAKYSPPESIVILGASSMVGTRGRARIPLSSLFFSVPPPPAQASLSTPTSIVPSTSNWLPTLMATYYTLLLAWFGFRYFGGDDGVLVLRNCTKTECRAYHMHIGASHHAANDSITVIGSRSLDGWMNVMLGGLCNVTVRLLDFYSQQQNILLIG